MSGSRGDYAGMSNDKTGENPVRRKPKVSWGRQFRPGLAGALVEAERRRRWTAGQHSCANSSGPDGGTASGRSAVRSEMSVDPREVWDRKIRPHKPSVGTDCVYVREVI